MVFEPSKLWMNVGACQAGKGLTKLRKILQWGRIWVESVQSILYSPHLQKLFKVRSLSHGCFKFTGPLFSPPTSRLENAIWPLGPFKDKTHIYCIFVLNESCTVPKIKVASVCWLFRQEMSNFYFTPWKRSKGGDYWMVFAKFSLKP